jgi:hypothetical protein
MLNHNSKEPALFLPFPLPRTILRVMHLPFSSDEWNVVLILSCSITHVPIYIHVFNCSILEVEAKTLLERELSSS